MKSNEFTSFQKIKEICYFIGLCFLSAAVVGTSFAIVSKTAEIVREYLAKK